MNSASTPIGATWPIHTKWRSSVVGEQDEPPCETVMFDMANGSETVGGRELPRGNATDASESVPESFVTSGGFSTLEGIAQRQANERVLGARIGEGGKSMVRISPADELFGQKDIPEQRTNVHPSQSAKSLLQDSFQLSPPTNLDPSHPTTSFSANQMTQIAHAVGLEMLLASYSMLEDLLRKARVGSGGHPVTSRYPTGRSSLPSVAVSLMGDSVASQSDHSLPTLTETEGINVVVSEDVLKEPCSSKQADAGLGTGPEGCEKVGNVSLETLQQVKSKEKQKKSCIWK